MIFFAFRGELLVKVLESVVEEMPKVRREGFQVEISLESRSSVFVNTSNPNVVILPGPKLSHSFHWVRISSQRMLLEHFEL